MSPQHAVAKLLEQAIPDARLYVHEERVKLVYYCPCGEVSSLDVWVQSSDPPYLVAQMMKDHLRRHVRSEGFEPEF